MFIRIFKQIKWSQLVCQVLFLHLSNITYEHPCMKRESEGKGKGVRSAIDFN